MDVHPLLAPQITQLALSLATWCSAGAEKPPTPAESLGEEERTL